MTTRETAKRWGCSQKIVQSYCIDGIIPSAEKRGFFWDIPEEAEKPPLSRHGLVLLLDTVNQLADGVVIKIKKIGYKESDVEAGFRYLSEKLFISGFDDNIPIEEALLNAKCTQRGIKLMTTHEEAKKKGRKKEVKEIGINAGKPHLLYKEEKEN